MIIERISLTGPGQHHHHQVDDEEADQRPGGDEVDRARRLPAAEEVEEPGPGRVHAGDMVRPVRIISGISTTSTAEIGELLQHVVVPRRLALREVRASRAAGCPARGAPGASSRRPRQQVAAQVAVDEAAEAVGERARARRPRRRSGASAAPAPGRSSTGSSPSPGRRGSLRPPVHGARAEHAGGVEARLADPEVAAAVLDPDLAARPGRSWRRTRPSRAAGWALKIISPLISMTKKASALTQCQTRVESRCRRTTSPPRERRLGRHGARVAHSPSASRAASASGRSAIVAAGPGHLRRPLLGPRSASFGSISSPSGSIVLSIWICASESRVTKLPAGGRVHPRIGRQLVLQRILAEGGRGEKGERQRQDRAWARIIRSVSRVGGAGPSPRRRA